MLDRVKFKVVWVGGASEGISVTGDSLPDRPLQPRRSLPTSSRRQQIVDLLREDIITGHLSAGHQLKQDELCVEFAVSPAPIREALRQLESEGLVQHFPNRGAFVAPITADDLLGVLLPVRLAIETYALCRRSTPFRAEEISKLEELTQAMSASADIGDLETINELDLAFHEYTVVASGSMHAVQLWRSVAPRMRAQLYKLAPRHLDLHEIPEEHLALIGAIRQGDPVRLAELLEEHIITSARLLLSVE